MKEKVSGLKQYKLLTFSLCRSGIWVWHSWVLWLWVSRKAAVISRLTSGRICFHSHSSGYINRVQLLLGYRTEGLGSLLVVSWTPSSVPRYMGLSIGQLTDQSKQMRGGENEPDRSQNIFWHSVTFATFSLLEGRPRVQPTLKGRQFLRVWTPGSRITRGILETANHVGQNQGLTLPKAEMFDRYTLVSQLKEGVHVSYLTCSRWVLC